MPFARGAESEVFSDENLPTGVKKMFDGIHQKLSSQKLPIYEGDTSNSGSDEEDDEDTRFTSPRNLRSTFDKFEKEPGILEKLLDG